MVMASTVRCRGKQRRFRDGRLAAVVGDAEGLSRLLREAGKRAYPTCAQGSERNTSKLRSVFRIALHAFSVAF